VARKHEVVLYQGLSLPLAALAAPILLLAHFLLSRAFFAIFGAGVLFVLIGAVSIWLIPVVLKLPDIFKVLLPWMFLTLSIGLGCLSAWQTIVQARRRALKKALATVKRTKPCTGCGELVDVETQTCPMCGRNLATA
jgi:hypothetical protein